MAALWRRVCGVTFLAAGDGVLTALRLMARMASTGRPLADLARVMRRLPQVLLNVEVADRVVGSSAPEVTDVAKTVEAELGGTGRVLLRPSGTEPLVRVMVEASTVDTARSAAERIAVAVRAVSPPVGA